MLADIPTQLWFNAYSVPVAVVSTVIFFVGLFVFLQNRRSVVNFSFFLICLAVNLWLYGISLMYSLKNADTALFIYKAITFLGVSYIAPCVYSFSVAWLRLYHVQKSYVKLGFLGGAFFYLAGLLTNLSFVGTYRYFWGFYPHYGTLSYVFLLFFFVCFFAAFSNFARAYLGETDQNRKTQIKFITIAFAISFTGSVDYIPKLFYMPIYPIGYISVFFWIMTVAYSIVKYRLMDIETVIHRTILWIVTSALTILPIIALFYLLGDWYRQLESGIVALLISFLFFVFAFYFKTIQPHIDHFFKRGELDLEEALTRFNDNLVQLKGLNELTTYIVRTISEVLYVNKVQIFLKNGEARELSQAAGPAGNATFKPSFVTNFIKWLEKEDRLALIDFVDLDPRFQPVTEEAKRFFSELDVKVSIPLVLNKELIGLINLGRKDNLKPFRAPEIRFLSELRRAATIALSNSLRLIEMQESLRKWNEELEERVRQRTRELEDTQQQLVQVEKLATIGTLAGGVAHEINNPLTAILANVQMLKLEAGDGDQDSIQLIEQGAKRCQAIVQKLMKFARKPADQEPNKEVDLNNVIQDALAFLSYQLEQENIKLITRLKPLPKVRGVPNELEQVFTNIILNARDAIKTARSSGVIEIETFEKNGLACARIKDDGIGISQEYISKIFDPFFTTKDIGRGTGLGLAITYGIVTKYDGHIDVSSTVGKGTIFTVTFPKTS